MVKGIITAKNTATSRLDQANNYIFNSYRKYGYVYNTPTEKEDNLFEDLEKNLLRLFNINVAFKKTTEYQSVFNRHYNDLDGKKKAESMAVKKYIRSQLFPKLALKEFDSIFRQFEKAWRSGLVNVPREIVHYAITNQNYTAAGPSYAEVSYKDNNWFIQVTLFDITIQNNASVIKDSDMEEVQEEKHPLANTLTIHFVLTDNGFKFDSFNSDNALLEEMCLKNEVKITPEILQQQKHENDFYKKVEALQFNIDNFCTDTRQEAAQAVLDEVLLLKPKRFDAGILDKLQEIVAETEKLLAPISNESKPDVAYYKECAAIMGEYSWGKKLAGLMMCLAGVVITLVSIVGLGVSLGTATPISVPGIIVGTSLAAAGGFLLFNMKKNAAKEMPLKEKMETLAATTEQMIHALPPPEEDPASYSPPPSPSVRRSWKP